MAPASPVNRVTRARAAAKKNTDEMNAPPKKTAAAKATTARKVKPAVEESKLTTRTAKAAAEPATIKSAPRRRVKVTPLDLAIENNNGVEEIQPEDPAVKKTSTRAKKEKKEIGPVPVKAKEAAKPEPKTSKTRVTAKEAEGPAAPAKTRGRPRKTPPEPVEVLETEKPTRQTRTRANSGTKTEGAVTAPMALENHVTRKKVTFQGLPENDKENQPLGSKIQNSKKANVQPATGIRARPIRKPAAAGSRKRTTATSKNEEEEQETHAPRALTPKKITQVTKSSTPDADDDEDELSGAKTPLRDLSQSPRRMGGLARAQSPMKRLDFSTVLAPKSPETANMMSPPRRLPASPFKNVLEASPKRGEIIPLFTVSTSQDCEPYMMNGSTSPSASALRQSPKRGMLDSTMFTESIVRSLKSPAKPTLMQSPAKRFLSPLKQQPKSPSSPQGDREGSGKVVYTRDISMSSHFRASRSPEKSQKVYNISEEEHDSDTTRGIDFDQSVLDVRSPMKVPKPPATLSEMIDREDERPVTAQHTHEMPLVLDQQPTQHLEAEKNETYLHETDIVAMEATDGNATIPAMVQDAFMPSLGAGETPLTTTLCSLKRFRDHDELSEDELQFDQSPEMSSLTGRLGISQQNKKARVSYGISGETRKSLGFTPLAAQFGGWVASSPNKQTRNTLQTRGIFSPIATQHIDGEVQVSRQSTPLQRKSNVVKKSTTPSGSPDTTEVEKTRFSFDAIASDTPDDMLHFTEEMEVRDLENEIMRRDFAEQADVELNLVDETAFAIVDATEIVAEGEEADAVEVATEVEELTTDLIKENKISDTAMLDFVQIAQEAEELAPDVDVSHVSSDSSIYGDENVPVGGDDLSVPAGEVQHEVEVAAKNAPITSPMPSPVGLRKIATPIQPDFNVTRFAHTVVSKVPLRPEGFVSPIKVAKKRSRSLSNVAVEPASKKSCFDMAQLESLRGATRSVKSPQGQVSSPAPSMAASTPGQTSFAVEDFGDSTLDGIELPDGEMEDEETTQRDFVQNANTPKNLATPSSAERSPLQAVGKGVLHGTVVYVDVHTTEGADASSIFIELLTQMGAKCVREWKWNPRASASSEDVASLATPARIGVTHVVYKDGGKRTLEKVRDAKGEVWCVGVGWVLDCERENKWLDESTYAVDPALLPRGGSRRRKSMEPRTLINVNGSIARGRRSISAEMTAAQKEELINTPVRQPFAPVPTLEVPVSQDETFLSSNFDEGDGDLDVANNALPTATPTGQVNYDPSMSPNTPYFLAKGKQLLVQQTCPPKQTMKGLFEVDAKQTGEQSNNSKGGDMTKRLEAARRKSMHWRPRVASPLSKLG